jgi:uncharacterized protein
MELKDKARCCEENLASVGSLLVAYSGGTDSAYLAYAAHRALGERMLAVIADSPSLPRKELADAMAFAERHGIPVRVLQTNELEKPEYARNDAQRCFHCKSELFTQMEEARGRLGFERLAYGMNLDDRGEFRPGQKAAVPVTRETLESIEKGEEVLFSMGFRQFRVRHHGELVRIEIAREELARMLSLSRFEQASAALKRLGYKYVTLDLEGYRSGSMNALLPVSEIGFIGAKPPATSDGVN